MLALIPGYQSNYSQTNWISQGLSDLHKYALELKIVENRSHATPAEFQALRDNARAIGAAASANAASSGLSAQTLADRSATLTTVLNDAPLDGWMTTAQWATVETRLQRPLDGLNVPQSLVNQTFADMQTLANSAGVTHTEFNNLSNAQNQLNIDNNNLLMYHETPQYGSNYPSIPDSSVYYTQNFAGSLAAEFRSRDRRGQN